MRIFKKIILFVFFINSFVFGQGVIVHAPPKKVISHSPVAIQAIIENNTSEITEVRIFFREAGQNSFNEDIMYEYMGVYQFNIPSDNVSEFGVEYFILCKFTDGSTASYPEVDPFNVPMFLSAKGQIKTDTPVEQKQADLQGGLPSNAIILSPEEGEVVASEEVVIVLSLFNTPDIDLKNVEFFLDGNKIQENITLSEELIVAKPKNISPGLHSVKFLLKNNYGDSYSPVIWNFTVVKSVRESERVFSYNGRVEATTSMERIRGVQQNIQQLRANARGSYDWAKFKAKVKITSQEDPARQPMNRMQIGFNSSFLNVNFGDINPRFNEFGLKGKRVRGIEAELKLRYFNLHFIQGEMDRAIQGSISTPDTLADGYKYYRRGYTYSKNVIGLRPYFGSGQHFQFGLSFLKVLDDTLSVNKEFRGIQSGENTFFEMDGMNKPQDNIILGTDMSLAIDNKRIVWQNDGSISLLNRDISGGALTMDDLDTFLPGDSLADSTLSLMGTKIATLDQIPVDPSDFSKIFIINENLFPLAPIVPDSSGAIGMQQILNMPSTAFLSKLKLNYFNNFITLKYHRVGPQYKSLANPYQQSDVQGLSISDRIRLFQNKVFVTINYSQKRDNLDNAKPSTTSRNSLNAGLSFYPGAGLPNITLNTMQYSLANDIDDIDSTWIGIELDSLKISDSRKSDVTMRQSISVQQDVYLGNISNSINLNFTTADRKDRITDRPEAYSFNTTSTSMISIGLSSEFPFGLKTNIKFSSNTNESSQMDKPYEFSALFGQGNMSFFNKNLNILFGYQSTKGSGQVDFTKTNMFSGGYIRLLTKHIIRTRLSYTRLNDRLTGDKFNDYNIRLVYSYNF